LNCSPELRQQRNAWNRGSRSVRPHVICQWPAISRRMGNIMVQGWSRHAIPNQPFCRRIQARSTFSAKDLIASIQLTIRQSSSGRFWKYLGRLYTCVKTRMPLLRIRNMDDPIPSWNLSAVLSGGAVIRQYADIWWKKVSQRRGPRSPRYQNYSRELLHRRLPGHR